MLGMRLLGAEHGISHPLFDDALFAKSKSWTLSTSHLGADCTKVPYGAGRMLYPARSALGRAALNWRRCVYVGVCVSACGSCSPSAPSSRTATVSATSSNRTTCALTSLHGTTAPRRPRLTSPPR
jgi:hypothetical protein